MSHVFLDTRDGRLALYLNGDLQFDARDERLYHEPLALIPTALAARRAPGRGLRVLVLGGGDGLALREVLRFPEVREVRLVDRDAEVLGLGRDALADLNRGAFRDARVRVHTLDARAFLGRARGYDVLIADLTYPRDAAGAALFGLPFFRKARAALRPEGVLAVNAVSPELTPEAFGCIGATLGAAGLWARPYAFGLPSFVEEGYGRWGFFLASSRPIRDRELRSLSLPQGAGLTPDAFLAGTRIPEAVVGVMRAAPNRTDELLYYLYNASVVRWEGPLRVHRFGPSAARPGPRLTAAQGFARWLRAPDGRRSVEELLGCLPLSQRGQTRAALLEWSHQAEVMFREVDLRAFVDRTLCRARELPRAWVRELRALRERIRDGLPPMDELLHQAYRVFAIFLLVLFLVNLFFPDNAYAKGFSSSSSRAGSGSFSSFHFTDPGARYGAYRYRGGYARGYYYGPDTPRTRVYDAQGRDYPAQRFAFTDPQGQRKPISALLALTRELQLLESGAVAYAPGAPSLPTYQLLLDPGRLRVLDLAGHEVLALLPTGGLHDEAKRQIEAQGPLIDKAMADHRRWLGWVGWASAVPPAQQAASELRELETIKEAVESARAAWSGAAPPPAFAPGPGWIPILPGVYLEAPASSREVPAVAVVTPDARLRLRPLPGLVEVTDEARFLIRLLAGRLAWARTQSRPDPALRWLAPFGATLGIRPKPSPPAGARS